MKIWIYRIKYKIDLIFTQLDIALINNMDNLIAEIKNEIVENYTEWFCEDEDMDKDVVIDEFKYYYGNHENSIYYFDFKIEDNMVLPSIDYITKCIEESEMDIDISVMRRISSYEGLKGMLLYWVMEDVDFDSIKITELP